MSGYILALDQGTSSCRAVIYDNDQNIVGVSQQDFRQIFPQEGWVEHDPAEIWMVQLKVAREAIAIAGITADQIACLGIANQRETAVVWERSSGRPIYNAIVWQDNRTSKMCNSLAKSELGDYIRRSTGLVVDSYFSATKLQWILKNVPDAMEWASQGLLAFGTIDSWLLWNLTGGKVHATDASNASRTMLYDIHGMDWDERLLQEFSIPKSVLPEVRDSNALFGYTADGIFGASRIPVQAILGDQQASLYGHQCFTPGAVKNTYGTGCFLLMNTGSQAASSQSGLITTIAWRLDGKVNYALEGSVFEGGSVIQWLRDGIGLIGDYNESEVAANRVSGTEGVVLVPGFSGLGAPHWDMFGTGIIIGLSRATRREHIIRAALESLALQVRDVLHAMERDAKLEIDELRVDGGAAQNAFLIQFQSDILNVPVVKPSNTELTALGVAALAASTLENCRKEQQQLAKKGAEIFKPTISPSLRASKIAEWVRAVDRAKGWKV